MVVTVFFIKKKQEKNSYHKTWGYIFFRSRWVISLIPLTKKTNDMLLKISFFFACHSLAIHLCVYQFIHPFIHSFIHPSIHSFILFSLLHEIFLFVFDFLFSFGCFLGWCVLRALISLYSEVKSGRNGSDANNQTHTSGC